MNNVPTWAKAIGIIMICLAALGIIGAISKITFPSTIQMQNQIMSGMDEIGSHSNDPFGSSMASTMRRMFVITPFQAYTVMVSGIVSLLGCGFYLFAGIRMMKLDPKNLQLAKYAFIGFIILNALTIVLVLTDGYSMMVLGAIMYPLIGLVFDVTLLIVMANSDKSAYGLEAAPAEVGGTLDDEII
jgi:hypothetical protein